MAILVTFKPTKPMSAKQYSETLHRLEAAGAGAPAGRLHHFSYGPTNALNVVDIWDNQANFDKFGAKLMPILAELDIHVGTPDVQPLHNSIAGR